MVPAEGGGSVISGRGSAAREAVPGAEARVRPLGAECYHLAGEVLDPVQKCSAVGEWGRQHADVVKNDKPDIENIKGLNFAAVKLTTVQVTKMPLWHICMICFAKPGLTEDLCIVQKQKSSIACYMCDSYTR
jgi:hypothetical protein